MTSTTAQPVASAIAQSAWPVVGIVVLYRLTPIFAASNRQTLQAFLVACAVSAVIARATSLVGNGPRRVITLAAPGAGAVAAAGGIHRAPYPAPARCLPRG